MKRKKTTATKRSKKTTKKTTTKAKRRGRKPGVWTLIRREDLMAFRKQTGLSYREVAEKLGVSMVSVRNWIMGKSTPDEKKQAEIQKLIALGAEARLDEKTTRTMKSAARAYVRRTKKATATAKKATKAAVAAGAVDRALAGQNGSHNGNGNGNGNGHGAHDDLRALLDLAAAAVGAGMIHNAHEVVGFIRSVKQEVKIH